MSQFKGEMRNRFISVESLSHLFLFAMNIYKGFWKKSGHFLLWVVYDAHAVKYTVLT